MQNKLYQNPIMALALVAMAPPRFQVTYCSQCGQEFGPGNEGYRDCAQHKNASWHKANDAAAMKLQLSDQTGEFK